MNTVRKGYYFFLFLFLSRSVFLSFPFHLFSRRGMEHLLCSLSFSQLFVNKWYCLCSLLMMLAVPPYFMYQNVNQTVRLCLFYGISFQGLHRNWRVRQVYEGLMYKVDIMCSQGNKLISKLVYKH